MQSLLKSTLLLIFFSVDLHAFEVKRTIFAFWDKPDVVLHYKLPQEINDDTIGEYFKFDELDKKAINSLHSKRYKFFINILLLVYKL